jgi:hypothetical protein
LAENLAESGEASTSAIGVDKCEVMFCVNCGSYFGMNERERRALKKSFKRKRNLPMRSLTFGFRKHELEQKPRRVRMPGRRFQEGMQAMAEPTHAKEKQNAYRYSE